MMFKLISCVLSFALIVSSVLPSLAQVPPVRPKNLKAVRAVGKTPAVRPGKFSSPIITQNMLLKNAQHSFVLPHAKQFSSALPVAQQILTHTDTTQRALLLRSDFPLLVLNNQASAADKYQAVSFYRKELGKADSVFTKDLASTAMTSKMADTIADVACLGLFGVPAQDAPLILQVYEKSIGTVAEPLMTAVCARALLRLQAYDKLETMSKMSFQQPELWQGIEQYAHTYNVPLTLAKQERSTVDISAFEKEMEQFGPFITETVRPNVESTFLYMNVGQKPLKASKESVVTVADKQKDVSLQEPAEQLSSPQDIQTDQNRPLAKDLSASSGVEQTQQLAEEVVGEQATVSKNSASEVAMQTSTPLYSSVLPVSPTILQRVGNWMRNLGRNLSGMNMADKQAQNVLEKRQPMLAQLRDIVVGEASDNFKKQALVKLYHQGVFSSFLKKQPKVVRDGVIQAENDDARGEALFVLYRAKYLDSALKAIANIQAQGSILAQLQEVITQEGFADLAKSAYEAEDVLPLENENFAGAVSGVPEADLKKIGDTVRTEHYATENMSSGVTTSKGIYYTNNIPFYYRNSKGELSSEPVGILTQVPANLYGRILSKLRLASQPGLTIPEGFVLALDEQGQWKFFIPKGNLSVVENNPDSKKILADIKKKGSMRVQLDTTYSTTDLLAMAHLLENNPNLNLELTLNTPHSLSQFLTGHALFVGNDAGNTLTGPFKESLKAVEGFVNTLTNFVSGIGYLTPIAGGKMMPTMSRWGNVKTTKVIYGSAAAALAFSLTGLGMYGTVDPKTLPLIGLAIPTVALVLGASLANSFIPTFLNFYKDPAARTAANLDFSTKKQMSRLGLSGITALAGMIGGNWTLVVPVGLALLAGSYGLFMNTPMYKEEAARLAKEKEAQEREAKRWAALSPQEQLAEQKAAEDKKAYEKEIEKMYVNEYKEFRNNQAEMKASKSRVKLVYASYAASLMILGQSANAAFGDIGQGFITLCMAATLGTRLLATHLVKKNIMTDDQLTGLSLPTLALTALALALLPYSGVAAGIAGVAGILHYMATAVPGQLDAARMQNIVTAEMQQRKQNVMEREDLTEAEKEAEVTKLTAEEKVWSAQASKDYSLYNARGLWGIGIATGAALLFADLGPQWTKDMLQWISNWYDVSSPALSLNRLLFLYSGSVASVLALKNLDLTVDGLRFFGKKTAITAQAIADKKITPKVFGINAKNAQIQLGNLTGKTMKDLEPMLVEYGISSEQKMTKILQQLQSVHNRLVAIGQLLGPAAVRSAFERESTMVKKFDLILGENDLSVMLRREFDALQKGLFVPGTQEVLEQPQYVEEGLYKLPEHYQGYASARMVIGEMDQMAYLLSFGQTGVDYNQFVEYMTRAREGLLQYEKANPADAVRVGELRQKIDSIGRWLLMQDEQYRLLDPLETDSPQVKKGKQALRDMLAAYKY